MGLMPTAVGMGARGIRATQGGDRSAEYSTTRDADLLDTARAMCLRRVMVTQFLTEPGPGLQGLRLALQIERGQTVL